MGHNHDDRHFANPTAGRIFVERFFVDLRRGGFQAAILLRSLSAHKMDNQIEESAGMTSYPMELRDLIGNRLLLLPAVAAVIHDQAGNLLLQEKTSAEGWSLPAGAIEPGETPQAAVIREVMEETGLVVSPTSILGVFGGREFRYTYPNGHQVEYVVTLFKCQVLEGGSAWTDTETKSLRYFARSDMPSLSLPYPISALFD